ncbi:Uncharacterized protein FWK35_00017884 [Aphis craccivora]|uniref:Uncharacterized protein n=1 Tax=Aphis craccivora TaxID=307492 RepID=A0A6G0YAM1_APHCR|nr:Uncharacterized protein FWK35_00017884 [Aphis craccivora]
MAFEHSYMYGNPNEELSSPLKNYIIPLLDLVLLSIYKNCQNVISMDIVAVKTVAICILLVNVLELDTEATLAWITMLLFMGYMIVTWLISFYGAYKKCNKCTEIYRSHISGSPQQLHCGQFI